MSAWDNPEEMLTRAQAARAQVSHGLTANDVEPPTGGGLLPQRMDQRVW